MRGRLPAKAVTMEFASGELLAWTCPSTAMWYWLTTAGIFENQNGVQHSLRRKNLGPLMSLMGPYSDILTLAGSLQMSWRVLNCP